MITLQDKEFLPKKVYQKSRLPNNWPVLKKDFHI